MKNNEIDVFNIIKHKFELLKFNFVLNTNYREHITYFKEISFSQQHPIETSLINFSTSAKQNKNNIRFMAENMCITKYIVKCKMCLKFSMQCNTIVHNKLGSWKALNKLCHASCLFFIFDTILTMLKNNFCTIKIFLKWWYCIIHLF